MDAYNDPAVREIWVKKSAQIGWTEILNNIIGYIIDVNPGPAMVTQPTLDMAQAWSKDRFAPMVRDTKAITQKVADVKSKSSSNTILHKNYPGGQLTINGANSPASLASRPIRDALCDEVDRYPPSAGTEGDPIKLIQKRQNTFWNKKFLAGSTPTIKNMSRIEHGFERTDQRFYFVPCPHCGEYQALRWERIRWENDDSKTAYYVCEPNGCMIEHKDKGGMLSRGEWRATAPFNGRAGFFINALYSPWVPWAEIVENYLEAKDKPEILQTWTNTELGLTYEVEGEQLDYESLYRRRESYTLDDLPDGILMITAAVDVQGDRLECEVKGWGVALENWGIEPIIIEGDPDRAGVWDKLEMVLNREYMVAGLVLPISRMFVDAGYMTDQVLRFCSRGSVRGRAFACHGVSGWGKPVLDRPHRRNRYRVKRFPIAVDVAKQHLQLWLQKTDPGPRYCHFNMNYDREYFEQITAEKLQPKLVKGYKVLEWVKTRARNEATDLNVYNRACIESINPHFEQLRENREKSKDKRKNLSNNVVNQAPAPQQPAPRKTSNRNRPRTRLGG